MGIPTLDRAERFNYSPYTVYNISLLFPEDNEVAIQASQILGKKYKSAQFVLGDKQDEAKPHDSLYMIYAKKGKDLEDRLKQIIHSIAFNQKEFNVLPDGYLHGKDGMFEIKRKNTDDVRALQKKVIESTQSIRESQQPYAPFTPTGDKRTKEWLESQPEHIQKNMKLFGYEEVGKTPVGMGHIGTHDQEGLRLHTTLTRIAADEKIDLSILPSIDSFKGRAKAIGIFEMGENGTCPREIAVYPLMEKALGLIHAAESSSN